MVQVEHPVTEGITGVNLPSCQLLVGMGVPLWRIPSIRQLYGKDAHGTERFDLDATPQRPADGHVVAVRITRCACVRACVYGVCVCVCVCV